MNEVTLNYEEYLAFTGWSESSYTKVGQEERIAKLNKMGIRVESVAGKGKKTKYTIIIPLAFWQMLVVQSVSFSEVGADYLNGLIEGKSTVEAGLTSIIKFDSEVYDELAAKYGKDLESVKTTCKRIRAFLHECDYINSNPNTRRKSHRVKKSFHTKEWVTDTEAGSYDGLARGHWKEFFKQKMSMFQEIEPTAKTLPSNLFGEEIRKLYSFGMADMLDVHYYRVAKETVVEENLLLDIQFVRSAFLESRNLTEVLDELTRRQQQYKIDKKARVEQAKAASQKYAEEQRLSKEEREAIKKQLHLIKLQRESKTPPATKEQMERIQEAVRSIGNNFSEA